jgi:D-methionine transport system ATP-binding protein
VRRLQKSAVILSPADAVISLLSVFKSYTAARADIPALYDINLEIKQGEVFGVIGQSGAGKSTLVRLINLLEKPSSGQIFAEGAELTALSGKSLRIWRREVGMIFQHFNLLSSKTVEENVAFPLRLSRRQSEPQIKTRVKELLARFELTDYAYRYPAQLSGGQKQRVGVARALACGPKILLCDEATSALDPQTTQSVLDLLNQINKELGLTIVLITHEMEVIRRVCDRVAVLEKGRIVELGNVSDVFLHPKHEATRQMVFEAEQIDQKEKEQDFARVLGHRVLRLTFRGESTYEPILGSVARKTGVDYSILSGRIDRIKGVPYGQLTLALVGGDIAAALQDLATHDVHIEELR